ncbi:MAG: aspartate 1-decarboxylase [Clostridia bacterium]|nr:aspartate 1-decarboxylase [Clostridia bacterium]
MMIEMLKAKIHRATVTDANINYEGSITISSEILKKSNIKEYEKVLVVDINNGSRFETYVIESDAPNMICVNGAAARLVSIGDKVIIMSFVCMNEDSAANHRPIIVHVDENNSPT